MRIIKLKKSEYTNLEALLIRANLVRENQAFPSNIFVNQKTYSSIQRELRRAYKKQNPWLSKRALEVAVNTYLLNLGPVVLSKQEGGAGLVDGHAAVLELGSE